MSGKRVGLTAVRAPFSRMPTAPEPTPPPAANNTSAIAEKSLMVDRAGRLSIYLSKEALRNLKHIAAHDGQRLNSVVLEALDDYLEKHQYPRNSKP